LRAAIFARRFEPESLEQAFLADCAQRFAGQRRSMTLLGAVTWIVYAYWDVKTIEMAGIGSETLWFVVGIRVGGFLYLLALLAVSMRPWFEREELLASTTYAVSAFGMYLCAYWQMRLVPSEIAHTYYAPALFVVISYTAAAFRLSATTLVLLVACIAAPSLLIWIEASLSSQDLSGEQYFVFRLTNILFAAVLLNASLSQQLERLQRRAFLREHELGLSNAAFRLQSQELQSLNEEIRLSSRQSEEKALAMIELKERLRASAERKNREKSQFLASAVHDLRQPLQAIGNALEPARLCVARGDAPAATQMLELAQRASTLMAEQLAALLEMSRLESGHIRAEIETCDLTLIADASVTQLQEAAAKQGVQLRFERPAMQVWVDSDRHFLGRVLRNLIDNGIKYSDPTKRPDCEVCVRLMILPACVRLEVEDNGVGIADEHLADGSILKPFFQVDNRQAQADKGVGLGLSIVNALLELMPEHGLDIDSAPGRGTRMVVTLPHGAARFVEAAADAEAIAVALMVQLAGLYVVMVEDDELVSSSMALLLSAHGALYESVPSFEALQELLLTLERTPDLVLSDFRLPNHRTALDVSRVIRELDPNIEILVLTGEVLSPQFLAALAPAKVLYKPIPAVELIRAIDSLVTARATAHVVAES
jgi:signal transduction histidine kinase